MMKAEQKASGRPMSAFERRLSWLTPLTLVLWFVTFVLARGGLEVLEFGSWEAVLLALLPVPFFAAFLWCFVSGIRGMDELERRIQLEALAFAFPVTVLLLMVLGLMELATELNPDDFSYRHVWAFLPLLYFAGIAFARGRYS
jgi:hypothetical protein